MDNTIVKFSKYITTRNGKRIYAEDYGIVAFPIYGSSQKETPKEKKEATKSDD